MNPRLRWLLAVAVCTLFLLVLLRPDHLNLGSLAVQPPPSGTKSRTTDERPDPVCPQGDKPKEPILRTWDPSLVLKGLPTSRGMGKVISIQATVRILRTLDNLRDDKFYITSWAVAGFSVYKRLCLFIYADGSITSANQFISYVRSPLFPSLHADFAEGQSNISRHPLWSYTHHSSICPQPPSALVSI